MTSTMALFRAAAGVGSWVARALIQATEKPTLPATPAKAVYCVYY